MSAAAQADPAPVLTPTPSPLPGAGTSTTVRVVFFVPGTPRPAGSKRAIPLRTGKIVVVDDCRQQKSWQAAVREAALLAMDGRPPTRCPLRLALVFTLARPKSHYGAKGTLLARFADCVPTSRPDATKLLRAVEDGLTGIVYADDAQCFHVSSRKTYGDRPGVLIAACWRPGSLSD